jgi:hypothetical protein
MLSRLSPHLTIEKAVPILVSGVSDFYLDYIIPVQAALVSAIKNSPSSLHW